MPDAPPAASPDAAVPADAPLGERLVAAVHAATGVHPGRRALHAKGVGAVGTFRSSGGAAALTTAAHLQPGATAPATVRFSNGSADPDAADAVRDGRGMAVKLRLADGTSTDLVALSLPVFFVRTPDDFLAFMAARIPDPATGGADLDKIIAFLGEHPEAQAAVELSMAAPIPARYTAVRFHGVHAFSYVAADGGRTKVRYRWEPTDGVETLTDDEAAALPHDHLQDALAATLAAGPASFDLVLSLGTDEDDDTDPTTAWPDDRPTVTAGTLTLTALPDDPAAVDAMIFDPTRVVPGIECSADAILAARAEAYGASYALRTAGA